MSKKIEQKSDITVIIPVHELNDTTKGLLGYAIQSVIEQEEKPACLMIVGTESVTKEAATIVGETVEKALLNGVDVAYVINKGATDFASQLNHGVAECKTEWFCLLEFDDELSSKWLKNASKYKAQYTDVDCFLPIVIDVNDEGGFLGFTNEAVWAAEFSTEMGIIDNNALLGYQNFNFDGMVMRKEAYERHGGLKPSMKLTFIYEFLLRITYFSSRVMVIPKFGYRHVNQREGSIFHDYKQTLTSDEARWWMSLAKKEYFHTKDRGLTYEKQTV